MPQEDSPIGSSADAGFAALATVGFRINVVFTTRYGTAPGGAIGTLPGGEPHPISERKTVKSEHKSKRMRKSSKAQTKVNCDKRAKGNPHMQLTMWYTCFSTRVSCL